MDRPKHRRLTVLVIALLAGGALLLLGRHWTSAPEPLAVPAKTPTQQLPAPRVELSEPTKPVETVARTEPTTAAARANTPANFRGRIVDAVTRQPVTEFEVKLLRVDTARGYMEEEPLTRSFKSKTGRFAWRDAPAGRSRATVSARGYQQFILDDLEISADKPTREFVMPLLHGYAIRGRVYEHSTGTGVAGASISFRLTEMDEDYFSRRPRTTSKDDGSFELDGVPGGDVLVSVNAPSHASRAVQVVVDEKTPALEIAVIMGGTIAGIVTTADGAPVKGSIHLEGPAMNFGTQTDAAGEFSFEHLRPGTYRVSAHTSEGSATQLIPLAQDESKTDIVLALETGRRVRGVVRGLQPTELDDVEILLRQESTHRSVTAYVDPHGAYALNGVPAGRSVITVFGHQMHFDRTVDVPADQDLTLDLVFPTGARLSGRVTKAGQPAAGATIYVRPVENNSDTLYYTTTAADGSYQVEKIPPGDYRLRAAEDISRLVSVAGDATLNIDIPAVQLAVRVLEDGGRVPIVGAKVYLRGSEPETARVRGDRETDGFGEFKLTGIEPGEIVLMIYKPGYEMHREKIAYSAPITNKTITLRKSAGIEVRVQPGSRRFPRGFTLTQYIPNNEYQVDLWMPLDREGVCHVPAALAGTTFHIGRFSGEPIVIEEWDGQSFELP